MIGWLPLVVALLIVRRRPTRVGGGGGWLSYAVRLVLVMGVISTALSLAQWALQSGFAAGLFEPGALFVWLFLIAASIAAWTLLKHVWATTDPLSQTALRSIKRWMMR